MRKLFLFSLIVICVFLCACTTQEQSYSGLYPPNGSAGLAYEANEDGTCSVTGRGTCTDQCIVIPSTSPDGKRVTRIKEKAFYYDDKLLSITLPETLESIEKNSFFQCTKLYEIINLSNMEIDKGYIGYHGDIGRYAKDIHKGPGKVEEQDGFFFYEIEGENYLIYPQINLASVIEKKGGSGFRTELFRNADFGIFNYDFTPVLLIEINDNTHFRADRAERDEKVLEICKSAKLPIVTFWVKDGIDINRMRKTLEKYLYLR